jgi:hypothetical protein
VAKNDSRFVSILNYIGAMINLHVDLPKPNPMDVQQIPTNFTNIKRSRSFFSGMEPQFHRLDYMSILNQPSHRFWECVASDDFPNHPTMLKGPTGPVVAASAVRKGAHQTITVGGNNVGDTLNYGVVHRCSAPKIVS